MGDPGHRGPTTATIASNATSASPVPPSAPLHPRTAPTASTIVNASMIPPATPETPPRSSAPHAPSRSTYPRLQHSAQRGCRLDTLPPRAQSNAVGVISLAWKARRFRGTPSPVELRVRSVWSARNIEAREDFANPQSSHPSGECRVVVGIIPWNFPAFMSAARVEPPIVAGNPIVVRPSSATPPTRSPRTWRRAAGWPSSMWS